MEVRILGPLDAVFDERPVRLGGLKQRALLAALALAAGREVPIERLAEAVWGHRPPGSVRAQVAIHVHGLRKTFKAAGCDTEVIVTGDGGYRLRTDGVRLDVREAERQAGEARAAVEAGRTECAAVALGHVLAMWRGPVLTEFDTDAISAAAHRLEDMKLCVAEEWADLELARGRHREVIGRLAGLVGDQPLREGLRERLMTALFRAGRQADALEVYQRGRQVLLDELGMEPGAALRAVHQAILRGSPPPGRERPRTPRPAQLPPAVSAFVGRGPELRALDALAGLDGSGPRTGLISGVAGVGKTSLALHWAHRVAGRFPDGQLYADLHGYDASGEAAAPAAVLERFLRALGIPGPELPSSEPDRAALLRATLAGRRVLVVLDNAASAAQVLPLLPDSPGCCVIVTSRRRLTGLQVKATLPLTVLTERESADLLGRVAGDRRISGEQAAAVRLAVLCDGLPLALRITAARLAMHPRWSLAELADRLADERSRLDQLSRNGVEVRGSIELSYRELSPRSALAFRRLGLLDAPGGFAPWLVAALLDTTLGEAQELLEQLVAAQLLQPLGPDGTGRPRYRFHDLIRLFARERAAAAEPEDTRLAVLTRAFGCLLGLAERARNARFSDHYPPVPHSDAPRWLPADRADALPADPLAWLESERQNLIAAVGQCADLGLVSMSWSLVATFVHLFETRACYDDWNTVATRALAACRAAGDLTGTATMLYSLGAMNLTRRRLGQAAEPMSAALCLFERLGDEGAQALVLRHLGTIHVMTGRQERGKRELERALTLFGKVGNHTALGHGLGFLSHVHMLEGRLETAELLLERGLAVSHGVRPTQAQLLKRLAEVYHRQGRTTEAIAVAERALEITVELDDLVGQAYVLHALGEARHAQGDRAEADVVLRRALHLARSIGDRLVEGRVLLALGIVRAEQGTAFVEQAAEIFASIGAVGWKEEALKALCPVAVLTG
ncbi:BTAD domain-containing putative transcriptional regulator [Spongiactinospora sp. TRM90649]|uniref:AfsR/SARP family transcriptional regulator n=1 Tax=Spongiactinospora sp. TRM90649 TaxID=3031114 RepID=UPI0023F61CE4|nr:BTAD domain-containing putative transcriptional regulator [Spongiactinospora sp. TRM90649]MDF5758951.1 BTAD domain-containing putative transcriptional regulator [Spongiactinospora sp. TRM90649]